MTPTLFRIKYQQELREFLLQQIRDFHKDFEGVEFKTLDIEFVDSTTFEGALDHEISQYVITKIDAKL